MRRSIFKSSDDSSSISPLHHRSLPAILPAKHYPNMGHRDGALSDEMSDTALLGRMGDSAQPATANNQQQPLINEIPFVGHAFTKPRAKPKFVFPRQPQHSTFLAQPARQVNQNEAAKHTLQTLQGLKHLANGNNFQPKASKHFRGQKRKRNFEARREQDLLHADSLLGAMYAKQSAAGGAAAPTAGSGSGGQGLTARKNAGSALSSGNDSFDEQDHKPAKSKLGGFWAVSGGAEIKHDEEDEESSDGWETDSSGELFVGGSKRKRMMQRARERGEELRSPSRSPAEENAEEFAMSSQSPAEETAEEVRMPSQSPAEETSEEFVTPRQSPAQETAELPSF